MNIDDGLKTFPAHYEFGGIVMVNIVNTIAPDSEQKLRLGNFWGAHYGWSFSGTVWYEDGRFYEAVYKRENHKETLNHPDLAELLQAVRKKYGRW